MVGDVYGGMFDVYIEFLNIQNENPHEIVRVGVVVGFNLEPEVQVFKPGCCVVWQGVQFY